MEHPTWSYPTFSPISSVLSPTRPLQQYHYANYGAAAYWNQLQDTPPWTSNSYSNNFDGQQTTSYQYPQQQSVFNFNFPLKNVGNTIFSPGSNKDLQDDVNDITASSGSAKRPRDDVFEDLPSLLDSNIDEELPTQATKRRRSLETVKDFLDNQLQPYDSTILNISELGIVPTKHRPRRRLGAVSDLLDIPQQHDDNTVLVAPEVHAAPPNHKPRCEMGTLGGNIQDLNSTASIYYSGKPCTESENPRKFKKKTKFPCSMCSKTFPGWNALQDHVKTHSDIQSHICEICYRCFFSMPNLIAHKATHKVKPYTCSCCEAGFKQRNNLLVHLVTSTCARAANHISETSDRSWSCLTCNKKFLKKESVYKHARLHETGHGLPCPVCPEKFTGQKPYTLVTHCKTVHPRYFKSLVADISRNDLVI